MFIECVQLSTCVCLFVVCVCLLCVFVCCVCLQVSVCVRPIIFSSMYTVFP